MSKPSNTGDHTSPASPTTAHNAPTSHVAESHVAGNPLPHDVSGSRVTETRVVGNPVTAQPAPREIQPGTEGTQPADGNITKDSSDAQLIKELGLRKCIVSKENDGTFDHDNTFRLIYQPNLGDPQPTILKAKSLREALQEAIGIAPKLDKNGKRAGEPGDVASTSGTTRGTPIAGVRQPVNPEVPNR